MLIKIKLFFMIFLFVTAHSVSAEGAIQFEYDIRKNCSEQKFSQAEMQQCVRKSATDSEVLLGQIEKQVLAKIQMWNEDKRYVISAKQKFEIAEKNFLNYRRDYCKWAASLGGGAIGTALEVRRNACIAELNNIHVQQLRTMMKNWVF